MAEEELNGKYLATMARPRGNDWLEDEMKSIFNRGVDHIVSLLEYSEVYELGLLNEGEMCMKMGMNFIQFTIPDVQVPTNSVAFTSLVKTLANSVSNHEKVVIHCRMGIGRASLVAAGVLIILGLSPSKVFDDISKVRNVPVPDTIEQKEWLLDLANTLV